jgi:hypothetical protein
MKRNEVFIKDLTRYIEQDRTSVSEALYTVIIKTWNLISSLVSGIELPEACSGYRDNFMFTWKNSNHYLEVEIFLDGRLEFFYRKLGIINALGIHNTEDLWGEDTALDTPLSSSIINKLLLFSHE